MPDGCWNREREMVNRGEITEIWEQTIRKQLEYAYENTACYRKLSDEEGPSSKDVPTVDDYQRRVPSVSKQDFRDQNSPQELMLIVKHFGNEEIMAEEVFPSLTAIHTGGLVWTDALRGSEESYWDVPVYDAVASVREQLESDLDVPVDVEPFDVDTNQAEWQPVKNVEEAI